ncbi:MAG TPA: hypothetical protein ENH07_10270 [Nitrospirae bacterium]|nr:hypothetical protein [Nitrospirota bacterium]
MKTFHFSDVHANNEKITEVRQSLEHIVKAAETHQPDLIVMAGDTFDSKLVKLDSLASKLVFWAYSKLVDIAPMIVIVGTALHDGNTVEVLQHIKGRYPLWVSKYPEQIYLTSSMRLQAAPDDDSPLCLISTLPAPTKQFWVKMGDGSNIIRDNESVSEGLGTILAGFGSSASRHECPHVLVGHLTVKGVKKTEAQEYVGEDITITQEQLGWAKADVICLGHWHYAQKIGSNIFYSGSIYRKDFGELETKGYYIHNLPEDSVFHEIPTRKLVKIVLDFTKDGSSQDCLSRIDTLGVSEAYVRVVVKKWADTVLDKDGISTYLASADELSWKIQNVSRETIKGVSVLEKNRLREKVEQMAVLRKETVPPGILGKCDILEDSTPDEIGAMIDGQ